MDLSEATRKFLEKKCTCAKCKAQQASSSSGCKCQAKEDSCAALLSFGGRGTPSATQAGGGCSCGAAPPAAPPLSSKPVGECGCAAATPAAPPSSGRSGGCCAPSAAPSSTKSGAGCACVGPSATPSSTKSGAACACGAPTPAPSATKTGGGCACSGPAAKPLAAQKDDDPCDCAAAKMDNRRSDSYPRNDSYSTNKSPINFGGATFGRKSSQNEPFHPPAYGGGKSSRSGGCSGSLEYSNYPSNVRYNTGVPGRDTLNTPIHLPGLLNAGIGGSCVRNLSCERECGIDTGCNPVCKTKRTGSERAGVRICNNEMVNMFVSFMLEAFGILVFFAVCTFTFWIALGFYITQLLVDLKKADRNIHVAIGIVLSLLILAFAITMVTHGSKSCPHRAANVIKSSGCSSKPKVLIPKPPCPASSCPKPKAKPMPKAKPKPKPRVTPCKAMPKPKVVPCNKFKPKPPVMRRKYTDCQGRAIYETSRRNSVLIEMKQPPTWLVWVGDNLNNFLNNRAI